MKKTKILLVDDEKMVVDSLKEFLKKNLVCSIFAAYDGIEAIKQIKKHKFDLVILDIKMPGKSGVEVIKELKKDDSCPNIIVSSAYDDDQVLQEVLELGVNDYIPKSVDIKTFFKRIEELVKQSSKKNSP